MLLQYKKLDMSCLNEIHKIDLQKENVVDYKILIEKNWNSPDLEIEFSNKIFRHPVGLIINYREVINYLKKVI
jgi:hypothetical protein